MSGIAKQQADGVRPDFATNFLLNRARYIKSVSGLKILGQTFTLKLEV
jgi:hypothetical protein